MNATNTLTLNHPCAKHVVILDKDNNVITKIITYNIETKEADVYDTNEDGSAKINGDKLVTKKVILEGSRLLFRVYPEKLKESNV